MCYHATAREMRVHCPTADGERVLAPEERAATLTTLHKACRVEYAPIGVLGVIAPVSAVASGGATRERPACRPRPRQWNYPFYNMFNHISAGLCAGDAVVVKISEYSAWSAPPFIALVRRCLEACGHSPELVQLVQGFGDSGAALVQSADKVRARCQRAGPARRGSRSPPANPHRSSSRAARPSGGWSRAQLRRR